MNEFDPILSEVFHFSVQFVFLLISMKFFIHWVGASRLGDPI